MNCKHLLNEDFINEHEEFMTLTEDNGYLDEVLWNLNEAYEEFNAVFSILEDQFSILTEAPIDDDEEKGNRTDKDPKNGSGSGSGEDLERKMKDLLKREIENVNKQYNKVEREAQTEVSMAEIRKAAYRGDISDKSKITAVETIKSFAKDCGLDVSFDAAKKDLQYMPEIGIVKKENIKDMGFPKNVIFFIGSLIDWIKRLIISFIGRIGNVLKLLFGYDKSQLSDIGDTKFYLDKFTKMQATGSVLTKANDRLVSIAEVPYTDVKRMLTSSPFMESAEIINEFKLDDREETGANKKTSTTPFVQINLADDMTDLKMSLDHFFNIFESSYGSNNEYLFGTEDVEMLLEVFKDAIKKIESHDVSPFYVAGKKALPLLDSNRLSNQLITTATNTDKLKAIYTNINDRVQKILKKITSTQLLASTELGSSYKYYSLSTYEEMNRIVKILEPKIKEMVKMEKELDSIKKKFEKITSDLAKLQKAFTGMTGIVYREGFNNSMQDLFRSARIVTQTITIRLTTLTMAIKTLRDIQDAISVALSVSRKSFEDIRKSFKHLL